MRRDSVRLQDMLNSIDSILQVASASFEEFESNQLLHTWVLFHLLVIGEAASTLSLALQEANPDIPWRQITSMRHFVIHEYFDIDLTQIWAVILHDLPELKTSIMRILAGLEATP